MSPELALAGGEPVRTEPFATGYDATTRSNIDEAEIDALSEVCRSQRLSGFVADSSEAFFGGPQVRSLEAEWSDHFDVEHCIAVNSWTSGLFACLGAADLPPGTEVIAPPITMSATAAAVLGNNCVPVFADVDDSTANLDPSSVRNNVSDMTGAIVAVHLFGYPADMEPLQEVATEEDLILIEDAAQAIGATYRGEYAGTIGDIGGFSLNVHKHIHTGEGGVIVTDDDELARRVQLIRNHGETVVGQREESALGELSFDYTDIVGQNYRMTELAAAVGREQLRKLPDLLDERVQRARELRSLLGEIEIVTPPPVRSHSTHSYYGFPLWYDPDIGGVELDVFVDALEAEGVPAGKYVEPLYNLPVYQEGNVHSNGQVYKGEVAGGAPVSYPENACPNAEHVYSDRLLVTDTIVPEMSSADVTDIARALEKLDANRDELRNIEYPN